MQSPLEIKADWDKIYVGSALKTIENYWNWTEK